mgnify:CR=1 FL=1
MMEMSGTEFHLPHNPDPTQRDIRYGQPDIKVILAVTQEHIAADTDKNCRIADI